MLCFVYNLNRVVSLAFGNDRERVKRYNAD